MLRILGGAVFSIVFGWLYNKCHDLVWQLLDKADPDKEAPTWVWDWIVPTVAALGVVALVVAAGFALVIVAYAISSWR